MRTPAAILPLLLLALLTTCGEEDDGEVRFELSFDEIPAIWDGEFHVLTFDLKSEIAVTDAITVEAATLGTWNEAAAAASPAGHAASAVTQECATYSPREKQLTGPFAPTLVIPNGLRRPHPHPTLTKNHTLLQFSIPYRGSSEPPPTSAPRPAGSAPAARRRPAPPTASARGRCHFQPRYRCGMRRLCQNIHALQPRSKHAAL